MQSTFLAFFVKSKLTEPANYMHYRPRYSLMRVDDGVKERRKNGLGGWDARVDFETISGPIWCASGEFMANRLIRICDAC